MANATDPSPWPVIPLSDPQPQLPSQTPAAQQISDRDAWLFNPEVRAEEELETVELSTALRNLFDSGRDQVVWNLSPARSIGPPGSEQIVRVDPRHEYGPTIARSIGAGQRDAPIDEPSWLIIVDNALDLLDGRVEQLPSALGQVSRILVVACEAEQPDGPGSASGDDTTTRRAAQISARMHFDYVGPIAAQDTSGLLSALDNIKRLGRPTLLHVRTGSLPGVSADVFPAEWTTAASAVEGIATADDLFRQIASQELATLARRDARIVVVSTSQDPAVLDPWQAMPNRLFPVESDVPHALKWCASLAAGGSRPFAFVGCEELQNSFGDVRQSISLKRAPVTLLVEPRATSVDARASSSTAMTGIRQLPHTSVLSPKDGAELRQMLAWCAAQNDPAVIWLPQAFVPQSSWPRGAEMVAGGAEQLRDGADVAIVAWGPMVAAAQLAAESLARQGIGAAIVNARFAQPLDVDTLERVAGPAACVVVVDDVEAGGGFSSWVLEQLLHLGITQPVSIVAPQERFPIEQPHGLQKQCAQRIVERCRWLSAPIVPEVSIEAPSHSDDSSAPASTKGNWLNFFGGNAHRMACEREQVYASQLSTDVKRWVAAYEKVGSRDLYLWKWCMHGATITTLPCVAPELRAHVNDTKLLSIILCVLMDDVADQHGDSHLLDALLEMACSGKLGSWKDLSEVEQEHAEVTRALWAEYWIRVASYPCYETNEPVLRFDLLQTFNMMRYSHLVNDRPYLLNMVEHDLYTPHNMMMTSFAVLDLMCSRGFPQSDVATLREMNWHAQCMGRIGNLLSTWRRELAERDFTSGVFARAMMQGDLSLDELEHGDLAKLEDTICSRGHEAHFFHKWLEHRERCHESANRIRSLDLRPVLEGHDRFFAAYLGSQGLI